MKKTYAFMTVVFAVIFYTVLFNNNAPSLVDEQREKHKSSAKFWGLSRNNSNVKSYFYRKNYNQII